MCIGLLLQHFYISIQYGGSQLHITVARVQSKFHMGFVVVRVELGEISISLRILHYFHLSSEADTPCYLGRKYQGIQSRFSKRIK
jgi:hypothetical protein